MCKRTKKIVFISDPPTNPLLILAHPTNSTAIIPILETISDPGASPQAPMSKRATQIDRIDVITITSIVSSE